MRETLNLKAEPRQATGKGPAYQTRRQGYTPAIVYGGSAEPQPVMVASRELERQLGTGNFLTTLYLLDIGGSQTRVIPRDIQLDPVTDRPVHVDFLRLEAGAKITLDIPVHFKGQDVSPGIKRGGTLNIVRHEVELICPVDNIPEFLEADLSAMEINDSLHISAIHLPEGVKPTTARDFTIASVVAPSGLKEETTTAEAAATPEAAAAPTTAEKK